MPYSFHRTDGDRLRRHVSRGLLEAQVVAKRATLAAGVEDIPASVAVTLTRVAYLLEEADCLTRRALDSYTAASWTAYSDSERRQQSFDRLNRRDGSLVWTSEPRGDKL